MDAAVLDRMYAAMNLKAEVPRWLKGPLVLVIYPARIRQVRKQWHTFNRHKKQWLIDAAHEAKNAASVLDPGDALLEELRHPIRFGITLLARKFAMTIQQADATDRFALGDYQLAVRNNPRLAEVMTRDYGSVRLEDTIPSKPGR